MFYMNYLELLLMILFILLMMFVSSVQPMVMVSSLILINVIYSYIIYNILGGYWFSYALMMVMLSGMLVLFTYMASLSPNEMFESYNLIYVFVFMVLMIEFVEYLYFEDMSYMSLMMWTSEMSLFNLFMVGYLLSVMLLVVWLSNMNEGAMRVL